MRESTKKWQADVILAIFLYFLDIYFEKISVFFVCLKTFRQGSETEFDYKKMVWMKNQLLQIHMQYEDVHKYYEVQNEIPHWRHYFPP